MSIESDKRPDPDLKVNIPQNNPFLRRANSPMSSPPLSGSHEDNRNSNNPFLDPDLISTSPPKMSRSPPRYPPEAAMRNMNLGDRPPPSGMPRPGANGPPGPPGTGQAAARLLQMKPGQLPPPGRGGGPPPRGMMDPRGPPPRHRRPEGERRPDGDRPVRSPSEERRRRERHERRRREREAGLKDSQGRPVPTQGGSSSSSRSKKGKGPHLDTIDKMDSTGSFLDPFGTGYHVSGPYDATVSKQNRKLRPIDAFAKDSLNMVMGGGKPTYDKHVHADVRNMYGHVDDAVNDYTNTVIKPSASNLEPYNYGDVGSGGSTNQNNDRANRGIGSFDATSKVEQVHGDETTGLGTSTFLEGTPAPASAIRRESESDDQPGGGLSRTRSLAQRFRNQRGRDRSNSSGIVTSPERRPAPPPPNGASRTMSPVGVSTTQVVSLSAGGLDRINESKPFFDDFDDPNERRGDMKKANVGVTLEDKGMKPAPTAVTRSVPESSGHQRTSSNTSSGGERDKKDGFLGRMRSLRGRKKEKGSE